MNERIKQLANEAGINIEWWHYLSGYPFIRYNAEVTSLQKFAELIINECIDKIETHRCPVGNSAAGEMAREWTYDALKEIRDEIKEQFGIKE